MADIQKVIKGFERCLVCDTSVIASAEAQKAYLECDYTVGLYCNQKKLLRDAIELLEEQHNKTIDVTDESFRFGKWMKSEMQKRNWNVFDLSYESGVPDSTLSDYLRDARQPSVRVLQLVCQAFGMRLTIEDDKQ